MHRRELLQAAVVSPSFLIAGPVAGKDSRTYAYVGCFTTEQRHGRGDGIHVYRIDSVTGSWTHIQRLGDLVNPSFLITSHDRRFLYSAHGDEHSATAFSIDAATGLLAPLNKGDTGGLNGAHLALSPDAKFLIVANYVSGTVAVLPVRPNGGLDDQIQLIPPEGKPGPHRVEQPGSHPHQIVFDPSGRFVLVPDKGLDRVFIFKFDAKTGRLTPTEQGSVATRAGSGPRHLAFHRTLPVLWVLNELNSTATTYAWNAATGFLKPLQILPCLPPDFTGDSTAAEIALSPNGRYLYCSNRGHDSIATFAVTPGSGLLGNTRWTPSNGKTPRYIGIEPGGQFLYCANEQGDSVTTFRISPATGGLTATGKPVVSPSAVSIAFARF